MSVTGFTEKPTYGFWVSMGVNAFHRDVVDLILNKGMEVVFRMSGQ